MPKYTEGDWRVKKFKGEDEYGVVLSGKPFVVAKMTHCPSAEANAKLIAAAPKLLKACKKILQDYKDNFIEPGEDLELVKQVIIEAE